MEPVKELKQDGLYKALQPSILLVCDSLSKYSCWLMLLLMTTTVLLWMMKKVVKDVDSKEATIIYSSSTAAMAESEAGSEDSCRHCSRVRIPVRDNNAFRIRQMYAAMKMGKAMPSQQKVSSKKK